MLSLVIERVRSRRAGAPGSASPPLPGARIVF